MHGAGLNWSMMWASSWLTSDLIRKRTRSHGNAKDHKDGGLCYRIQSWRNAAAERVARVRRHNHPRRWSWCTAGSCVAALAEHLHTSASLVSLKAIQSDGKALRIWSKLLQVFRTCFSEDGLVSRHGRNHKAIESMPPGFRRSWRSLERQEFGWNTW